MPTGANRLGSGWDVANCILAMAALFSRRIAAPRRTKRVSIRPPANRALTVRHQVTDCSRWPRSRHWPGLLRRFAIPRQATRLAKRQATRQATLLAKRQATHRTTRQATPPGTRHGTRHGTPRSTGSRSLTDGIERLVALKRYGFTGRRGSWKPPSFSRGNAGKRSASRLRRP